MCHITNCVCVCCRRHEARTIPCNKFDFYEYDGPDDPRWILHHNLEDPMNFHVNLIMSVCDPCVSILECAVGPVEDPDLDMLFGEDALDVAEVIKRESSKYKAEMVIIRPNNSTFIHRSPTDGPIPLSGQALALEDCT